MNGSPQSTKPTRNTTASARKLLPRTTKVETPGNLVAASELKRARMLSLDLAARETRFSLRKRIVMPPAPKLYFDSMPRGPGSTVLARRSGSAPNEGHDNPPDTWPRRE